MECHCTRTTCPAPGILVPDLPQAQLTEQVCPTCGMPLCLAGRYWPVRLLAEGGFGDTYLARDLLTPSRRSCVVKRLHTGRFTPGEQLAKAQDLFYQEAEVLEILGTHPQIPYLHAFFTLTPPVFNAEPEVEYFYLVEEFIPGQDLLSELQARGPFSEGCILDILDSLLPILSFIHDQGIIHRDLKPANIIRHEDGTLYLVDFGVVRKTYSALSRQSTIVGSPAFAPPEQQYGTQVVPASDLYALGVTCITLLTGYDPTNLYDAGEQRWHWRPLTQISPGFADILDKLLQPRISERYSTAQAVQADLRTGQPDKPVPDRIARLITPDLITRLRGPQGFGIRDRRYLLKVYPRTFVGSEATTWMVRNLGLDRIEAVTLGQALLTRGLIHHVVDAHSFRDGFYFYRFYADESETDVAPQSVIHSALRGLSGSLTPRPQKRRDGNGSTELSSDPPTAP
ncbi:MAG: protein kinase [Gloeomargaritaceae cyanobacterium C42_A2020_066]|nr:protein kinase [Gloeomargaritaceae cyanobacterium C42_A2020_066]